MPRSAVAGHVPRPAPGPPVLCASVCVLIGLACACGALGPSEPRHYLVITHSALNRITFFDLDRREVVGALPAQKLPHDMLLSADRRRLVVLNSGAQCATTYHLGSRELWRMARDFMRRDTVRAGAAPHARDAMRPDTARSAAPSSDRETAAPANGRPVWLNPDPVQQLPASVATFHLTDPTFPDAARGVHARVRATGHSSCFDCHARSHGGKPFGPVFSRDGRSVYLVHLAYRNIAVLDAATLKVRRRIPLGLPDDLEPVEVWIEPDGNTAWVTCRNLIGMSRPGRILVVDLPSGRTLASIPTGIYPWHMLPDPSGRRLLVNNFQSSRISVVDMARRAIVDSIVVQNGPSMMALVPGTSLLLVSCFYTDRVLAVNLDSHRIEAAIPVGANPTSMLIAADRRRVLVLCGGESELAEIDLSTRNVVDRHPLLFGAYAFHLVDRDDSGRWVGATGPTVQPATAIGARQ